MTECEVQRQSANLDLPRVAYLTSRFPKLTETFVLYEILALERHGLRADVYSLQRESGTFWQPGAERVMERARFAPILSVGVAKSNLIMMARRPGRYLGALWTLLRANFGSLRYLGGALVFFPKTVHFARRMADTGVEHLHAHFASHPAASAFVIHRLTDIPFSFTAHGSDIHRDQHMLEEKVAEAAFVVTISEYNRRFIEEACGSVADGKLEVVHCGVDTERFSERDRSSSSAEKSPDLTILCIGTLHEVKGQTHLIRACELLASKGIAFTCHLIGDGPDRPALKRQVSIAGLDERVVLHGLKSQAEVAEMLRRADIVVAPSQPSRDGRREGIPVVLMEAMSSSVSVVASRLSGIPELVEDEVSGLLVEPGDSSGLAVALERLALDEVLRRRLAAAGRATVERSFNLERNADQLVSLFLTGGEEAPCA